MDGRGAARAGAEQTAPEGAEAARGAVVLGRGLRPCRLVPGSVLLVGRDLRCQLVVAAETVSRRHARLSWPADGPVPVVTDLSSANGTFVAGVAVEGDCPLDPARGAWVTLGEADLLVVDERALLDGRAGLLRSASPTLGDLLRRLERELLTGTVELGLPAGRAELELSIGRLTEARCGRHRGAEALIRTIRRAREGTPFRFVARPAPSERTSSALDLRPSELFGRRRCAPPSAASPDSEVRRGA